MSVKNNSVFVETIVVAKSHTGKNFHKNSNIIEITKKEFDQANERDKKAIKELGSIKDKKKVFIVNNKFKKDKNVKINSSIVHKDEHGKGLVYKYEHCNNSDSTALILYYMQIECYDPYTEMPSTTFNQYRARVGD
jgi:hypothetical protein